MELRGLLNLWPQVSTLIQPIFKRARRLARATVITKVFFPAPGMTLASALRRLNGWTKRPLRNSVSSIAPRSR
jgi:hypothetical protein